MRNKKSFLSGIGVGIGIAVVTLFLLFAVLRIHRVGPFIFPFWERRYLEHGFINRKFKLGVIGTIESLGDNQFTVKDRSGGNKRIAVDDQTILWLNSSSIKFFDLKKDDRVVVIGDPQSPDAVKARIIKVRRFQ